MTSKIMYAETQPLNNKATYEELETVDFVLDFPDRKMVANSLRIEGVIDHQSVAGTRNTNEAVQFDGTVGVHNIIDSVNVELQNSGIVESINSDYGRMVKMMRDSTLSKDDYHQASKICELSCPSNRITRELTRGRLAGNEGMSFSFKPEICINNAVGGDGMVSYRKTGFIKISINLSRNANFYHGVGNTATQKFVLSKLKCKYMVAPDDGSDSPVMMKTSHTLKNSLNSENSNISAKVPAVCSGVSMSLQKQVNENSLTLNNLALERPPSINQIDYMFNDTNKYIQYSLRSYDEYLKYGIESLEASKVSGVSQGKLKANEGFLLGLRFNGLVDLSVNNFNIQIQKGDADAFLLYQVYHSSITV